MMDSNREERRLQRQRGAQRHQVQDFDFGSPFPTTAVSQRITRSGAAPQSELPSQPSNRRTPGTQGRGGAANSKSAQKRSTPTPISAANDVNRSANTSAKRRKLGSGQDRQPSSPSKGTRSRTTPQADLDDLAEEEPAAETLERQTLEHTIPDNSGNAESEEELDQVRPAQTPKSRRFPSYSGTSPNEITESPRDAPGSGQRQEGTPRKTNMPGARLFEDPGQRAPPAQIANQDAGASKKAGYRRSPQSREVAVAGGAIDELSPDRQVKSRLDFQHERFSANEGEGEEAEAIDDVETAQSLQKTRKRKSGNGEGANEFQEEELEEFELSLEPIFRPTKATKSKKSKGKASPAAQRQPKKKSKTKSASRKSGATIPIVVHRLTRPVLYAEDETDADILNEDVPFTKRSGVNAVDVLSQFCDEIVESGLQALEEGGSSVEDPAIRREYRTKLRAVEAFQEELRTQLLELTMILDADYLLTKRVKAAQKEKIELREKLVRLRGEREKIALRMDEVRIKHENSSKEAQEQAVLSTALHDIELAVSRGLEKIPADGGAADAGEPAPPDLAVALRTLAGDVSSDSPEGGILKQVKEFNAFLERAALALEARP